MFHSELYSSSIASGANNILQLTGVFADAVLAAQNNGFTVVSDLPYFTQVMGVGAHLCHVRPQANSMQPAPYPSLSPNNRGSAFESPPRTWDLSMAPWQLKPSEEFDILASQNSGGNEVEYVLVNFADGMPAALAYQLMPAQPGIVGLTPGRAFTVHAVSSTTLSPGAWTTCQLTLDLVLPAGSYALLGLRAFSATALFCRVSPVTGIKWRPGGIAVQAYDQMDPWWQRMWPWGGKYVAPMGEWINFYQNVPPRVDMFSTGADTAQEFWLDLVYKSSTPMPGV